MRDRIREAKAQLNERSKLWYWYRENPRQFIVKPDGKRKVLSDMQALEAAEYLIEEILGERNNKKALEKIAKLFALTKPAFEEARRVIKLGSVVDQLDALRKKAKNKKVAESLTKCYERAIRMYRTGVDPPVITRLPDGSYELNETDRGTAERAEEGSKGVCIGQPEGGHNTESFLSELTGIRLDGLYVSGLQKTLDSLIERMKMQPDPGDGIETTLGERASFWIAFSKYSDCIDSRMAEAIESMEPVDVSDIPPELLITALRIHNHSFKDFPLRYDPINTRLVPG